MNLYPNTRTLRELDAAAGAIKGSAFRAFKRSLGQLREGVDYHVLSPDQHLKLLEELRSKDRIYPSSINVVLLTPGAAQRVLDDMKPLPSQQRPQTR